MPKLTPFFISFCNSFVQYIKSIVRPKPFPVLKTISIMPPANVAGMTVLDKSKFKTSIQIWAIKIEKRYLFAAEKKLKEFIFKRPNLSYYQDFTDDNLKLILLNPEKISSFKEFGANIITYLKLIKVKESDWLSFDIELTYDNWKLKDIFKAVLPSTIPLSSFTLVGHIAQVNLREFHLPYKHLIGQVILDKCNMVKTVVNKTDIIQSIYRNFEMEILAGENDMIVTVRENKCTFQFDFSRVYWNSRLGTEHQRIVDKLQAGDILYDVFAGVGSFVIPAAKKKCAILANDLNPDSIHWLKENIKLNKIKSEIQVFNKDAKDFILNVIKKDICERWINPESQANFHIVMNLPSLALDFIIFFRGLFSDFYQNFTEIVHLPIIHIYCFSKEQNPELYVMNQLNEKLKISLNKYILDIYNVRYVAPFKAMICISFKIPAEILFSSRQEDTNYQRK